MSRRIKYKVGTKWGKLTIISIVSVNQVEVQCDCGSFSKIIYSSSLANTKSCGCVWRRTHGKSQTDLYHVWEAMKQRCLNPNCQAYKYYGKRGITICDDWLKFESFEVWAKKDYTKGLTIERLDNDKGYLPDNCAWVTMSQQAKNRRTSLGTSGYRGVTWHKSHKRWVARYYFEGKTNYVGEFKTPLAAHRARLKFIRNFSNE